MVITRCLAPVDDPVVTLGNAVERPLELLNSVCKVIPCTASDGTGFALALLIPVSRRSVLVDRPLISMPYVPLASLSGSILESTKNAPLR